MDLCGMRDLCGKRPKLYDVWGVTQTRANNNMSIGVLKMALGFPALLILLLVTGHGTRANAENKPILLDGLWFTCEYAHSQIPPSDDCAILDDDGFLVEGDYVWHMKVQDGDKQGCRGDRAGNCFKRDRKRVTAKKKKIGAAVRTSKGAIIEYLWCGQPYEISHGENFSEVRPVEPLCAWTSKKTYYISRWAGEVKLVE